MRGRRWLAAALLIQAACFGIAQAQQYKPAALTAGQVLQKAEQARGDLQDGAYVEVEDDRYSGLETTSTTHMHGGDYIEYDKTGPFITAYGSYQGQHWSQNANGIVTLLSNFHSKVDPNVLAWEHPENPAYHVRVLGLTSTDPQEYVVEANPPGGSDQYRYYNATTFVLDRVVTFEKDRYRHVREYSDYRTVDGETRWFRSTYSDGRPQNDETDRVLSFEQDAATAAFAIPASRPLFAVGDQPITVPAQFTDNGIVVRVNVGNRGLDFLLDSGASSITMDPGIAHELGIEAYGKMTETIGGNFDTSLASVPQMSVGSLQMHNVAIDLGPINDRAGNARVVGLLGFDFLASAVPCIDFQAKTVTMYSRAAFASRNAGFQAMPMMVDDGVPRVPAFFEKKQGWFLLDTGAFGTLLYNDYLGKLPSAHIADSPIDGIQAVGGLVSARPYTVSDFAFGPVLFRNALVTVPEESTFDMVDYDGIIGRDALSVFDLCLDYTNRQAFLKSEAK
jgi:hypothetical protein